MQNQDEKQGCPALSPALFPVLLDLRLNSPEVCVVLQEAQGGTGQVRGTFPRDAQPGQGQPGTEEGPALTSEAHSQVSYLL